MGPPSSPGTGPCSKQDQVRQPAPVLCIRIFLMPLRSCSVVCRSFRQFDVMVDKFFLSQNYYWTDYVCKQKAGYICKRKPISQISGEKEITDAGCKKVYKNGTSVS
ncbi:hypothetical protein Q9233_003199 [Columba guinea]|nr:hypothetical protein Q9233_003199 [Columba guinea]